MTPIQRNHDSSLVCPLPFHLLVYKRKDLIKTLSLKFDLTGSTANRHSHWSHEWIKNMSIMNEKAFCLCLRSHWLNSWCGDLNRFEENCWLQSPKRQNQQSRAVFGQFTHGNVHVFPSPFVTFVQIRIKMATTSRHTKPLFFLGLLLASLPACIGLPEGQSSTFSTSSTLIYLCPVFLFLIETWSNLMFEIMLMFNGVVLDVTFVTLALANNIISTDEYKVYPASHMRSLLILLAFNLKRD